MSRNFLERVGGEFQVYSRFNLPGDDGTEFPDDGRTQQEFKDECDINAIMRRVAATGVMPPAVGVSRYADFSEVGDFMEAQEILLRARSQFEALPSEARDKFGNDPARFLEWIHSKDVDAKELRRLGLLSDEAIARMDAVVVPPVVTGG